MNILLFRDLPAAEIDPLKREFPAFQFRQTTRIDEVLSGPDWPEVVFGNLPSSVARQLPHLRWLQIVSSGIDDYLDLAASPITVTTAHGLHANIIAQHTLMMVLMFERGQSFFAAAQRQQQWRRRPDIPRAIENLTLGLVGCGAIGRELARIAQPLGIRVIATKLNPAESHVPGVEKVLPWARLDQLVAASDHLVLALPLTATTRHVLDAKRIRLLKADACVHNVSRGGLIDEDALLKALQTQRLRGASLDTFEVEPLPPDSPWWTAPHVVVTPHIAGHHRELGRLTLERFRANLRRHASGETLHHIARLSRGY